ncbi:hypothetical protein LINPERPRIM_LOCUS29937 [Linum perenne]
MSPPANHPGRRPSSPSSYNLEFRSISDDAWYAVRSVLRGKKLTLKYKNFGDDVFEPQSFSDLEELQEFKARFRSLSRQLRDSECKILAKGTAVSVSHSFHDHDNRFYDAVVDNVEENGEDADLGGHIPRFALLVDNLEKDISPSALMHLIHQETSLLVGVRISPIMYPETFTKAVIVVESGEQLEELCKFLDSPSHFVVSESGRPLVVTEKNFNLDTLARPMENLKANGLASCVQRRSIETNCGLRVVKDGSVEYEAAKRMKVIFMEFAEHEKIMIEDLAEKEKDIMES